MKTFSVAIKSKQGHWITNWHEYFSLEDIDWEQVETIVRISGWQGYGYYYGHNSSGLTSSRTRTILYEKE